VVKHGVTIIGETNLAALVSADSSSLYARNVLEFLKLIVKNGAMIDLPADDDIVAACMTTHQGRVHKK
jgi:NAD(P) transhydrogenase subunit alpha